MTTKSRVNWLGPVLLLALGSLNVLFGALQLNTIQHGPPEVPDAFTSMHYFETPIPIVLHIVAGILFNLLGPFQFAPGIRRRWPAWHRWSGRTWIVSGFLVALTGIWMNQFFPAFGGPVKYTGVIANSLGLLTGLIVALRAILARNISRHRAWMMRAFAFGLGPATQRVFVLPIFIINQGIDEAVIGWVVWFGFLVNLAVVEWMLWRERRKQVRKLHTSLI